MTNPRRPQATVPVSGTTRPEPYARDEVRRTLVELDARDRVEPGFLSHGAR